MPSKFQIYVDKSLRQPPEDRPEPRAMEAAQTQPPTVLKIATNQKPTWPRFIREEPAPKQIFQVDLAKIYPVTGGEFSIEEIQLVVWRRRQEKLRVKKRSEELELANQDLLKRLDAATQQILILSDAIKRMQDSAPTGRVSIVPQSLQPIQNMDPDTSCYGGLNEAASVVQDCWRDTVPLDRFTDKFTVPIDQSQYIRENVPTSTPNAKDDKNKKSFRRMSRPSMGGSPTLKLSPITETSRDCQSKSSSSSSAMSTTPGTTLRKPAADEDWVTDRPDRPLDPNDPTTYLKLLKTLAEPVSRRKGYVRIDSNMPTIKDGACFHTGGAESETFLIGNMLSEEARMYIAHLLTDDDSEEQSNSDLLCRTIIFRFDQPQNDWLFYILDELHRRLVRQKIIPDIELSVINADPALMYNDGSILIYEYFKFVSLEDYFSACVHMHKQFPKAVGAYIALELLQLVKSMHKCDIIHMNLMPHNIIVTGCPNREEIFNVNERTSVIKLIGYDHSADMRLLPCDHKFSTKLDHLITCQMVDEKPWSFEVDWYGVLCCIHKMFFLTGMKATKVGDRWQVDHDFRGCPTNVWATLFDELLNIQDLQAAGAKVNQAVEELSTWVKANISYVLKEAATLDMILKDFRSAPPAKR